MIFKVSQQKCWLFLFQNTCNFNLIALYLQLELTKSSAVFNYGSTEIKNASIPKSPSKFRRKRESQIVQH